jgi:hypothetical protein
MAQKPKKTIFTLNIDNYAPEITELTYPFFKRYADKIGAEFTVINKRKFPDYPVWYEKFQMYELSRDNEWSIFFDPDCLIHPSLFDITEILQENTVLTSGADFAGGLYKYDNYFRRDGRSIAAGSCLMVASYLCRELWEPLNDITLEEAVSRICLTIREKSLGLTQESGLDDYIISRNIAKYHLNYKTFAELLSEIGEPGVGYFFHNFGIAKIKKVEKIKEMIKQWGFV